MSIEEIKYSERLLRPGTRGSWPSSSPERATFIDVLRHQAAQQPDHLSHIFLVDGESEEVGLTYAELERRAMSIAALLQNIGATGQRVLLLYPPGLEYIAAFFGCLYAGAVAIPAYPPRMNRSLSRLQAIANDAQPVAALTTVSILSKADKLFDHVPELKKLRWINTDNIDRQYAQHWREPRIDSSTLAFLQYTSGSTASPKGVMVSHGNLLDNQKTIQKVFGQSEQSIIVGWLPLYHDMGLIGNVLQPLFAGAPCILMSPVAFLQRPLRWLQAISNYRATTSGGPNFAFDLCVNKISEEEKELLDLSTWNVAFNGAEPIQAETFKRFAKAFGPCGFRGEAFYPCYGLAEATLLVSGKLTSGLPVTTEVSAQELKRHRVLRTHKGNGDVQTLVSSGGSLQHVVVVDPESCLARGPEEVGEIWVSGPSVAHGYWNLAEESKRTFEAQLADTGEGPFLRTGDLGFIQDGELFVTGRLKDLIIVRGLNYYPQDIEATAGRAHQHLRPGCGAAFSLTIDNEERLVIVQELIHRHPSGLQQVCEAVVQAVAEEHELQVHALVLLKPGDIPKTSSGKIQRHECRARFLAGSFAALFEWQANIPAAGKHRLNTGQSFGRVEEIEVWLKETVAERLGIELSRVDANQPLSSYVIDSLQAVELAHAIEATVGINLSLATFLQQVSITELAIQIGSRLETESTSGTLHPIQSDSQNAEHLPSFGQEALGFLQQLEPGSSAYNIARALRFRGPLDRTALRHAFQESVNRHAALRTSFFSHSQRPACQVRNDVEVCFREEEASSWSKALLSERLSAEAHRPFNLEEDALLRVTLFARSENEHVLLLTVHHIAADLWSMGVLLNEVVLNYEAALAGSAAILPPLALEYADYTRWQRSMLQGDEGERLWSYWQKQLSGDLPVVTLPTDKARPAAQTFYGKSHHFTLDRELTRKLKALAHEHGATLYMTLLASFQVWLHHYTGQKDILVGSPVSGRSRVDFKSLVGYFVNTVVMRADLSGRPPFTSLLEQVRQSTLEALEHQEFPFALLVERLQPERDLSRSPLFQIMFVMQNMQSSSDVKLSSFALGSPGAGVTLGALTFESVQLEQRIAQFDLTLMMAETGEELSGCFEYSTDLFESQTIERMAGHFRSLLESIVDCPERRVSGYSLLSAVECKQLLVEWNNTQAQLSPAACVHQLFAQQAAATPGAVALVCGAERMSYAELDQRAEELAGELRAQGVGPEVRVGICMPRSLEMVVALLAVWKAGGAYVPLDPSYPQERLSYMVADSGAALVLTTAVAGERLAETDCRKLYLDGARERVAERGTGDVRVAVSGQNLAYVIYTSGSTGQPKGVGIEHRSVVAFLEWGRRQFGEEQLQGTLAATSICFDLSVFELFAPLVSGGTVVLVENVLELAREGWSSEPAVTLVNTVPSAMAELLRLGALPETVATVNLAGEALSGVLAQQVYEQPQVRELYNLYGPTEDTTYSTGQLVKAGEVPTIGRPLANGRAYVLTEQLGLAPIGVVGELYLSGAGLARGYLGQAAKTGERFVPDPYGEEAGGRMYRTGDRVRWLRHGELEYLGRVDQQVKLRGYRIELGEIEEVLRQREQVREAVVRVRAESGGGGEQQLECYVVGEAGAAVSVEELQRYLEERLPGYMVPASWQVLEELPLTPNGKIDRGALGGARLARGREYVAARSETEARVARIWSEVLGVERVGVEENFFTLGGHSLLATQVVSRLRQEFEVEIALRWIFEAPTISRLAQKIEGQFGKQHKALRPPVMRVERTGGELETKMAMSFGQERFWFLHQLDPGSSAYNMSAVVRLKGTLDVHALGKSLNEIIQRHEILRTRFISGEGKPVQVIVPHLVHSLTLEDSQELNESEQQAELSRIAAEEAQFNFDLSQVPLLRSRLLKLKDDEHALLLTTHHIVWDGWSTDVFIRELAANYEAFLCGKASPLAELPLQYADFAAWQRALSKDELLQEQLEYWKQQLANVPTVIELPTDRSRAAVQTYRGGRHAFTWPHSLSKELTKQGGTLFTSLLAGLQALLYRYTQQKTIVVGTPSTNRNQKELEELIGFFVNTLAMRADVDPDMTFRELLMQVRETALDAYAHQDLPFEKLVEELQPERNLSHTPLFQVMLVLQGVSKTPARLADLELELLPNSSGTAKFDLLFNFADSDRGLNGELEYNLDLFDSVTMQQLTDHFEMLLASAVANPDLRLSQLPLMNAAEEKQIVVEWNATQVDYSAERCIHQLVAQQVAATPGAVALVCGAERMSYAELDQRAEELAGELRAQGVGPEVRVGICMPRSLEMVVALLAVWKAGGAYVPLDPSYPQERLSYMVADSGAALVLTTAVAGERLAETDCRKLYLDGARERVAERGTGDVRVAVSGQNLAYVIYTSGSTGQPKGVGIEHRSVVAFLEWGRRQFGEEQLQGTLAATSICFDLSVFELFAPLVSGGTVVLVENVLELAREGWSSEPAVTLVNTVPSAMAELLRLGALPETVATVNLAGEALSGVLAQQVYEQPQVRELYNLYGPTEDTTYSTGQLVKAGEVPTIGRPLANGRAYVLTEQLGLAPIGVVGELYLSGAGLARGYLGQAAKTGERFVPDPYGEEAGGRMYRTGDRVRWLRHGELEYLGRVDQQVKLRGYRIELGEIEEVLRQQEQVREAVVRVRAESGGGGEQQLECYVVGEAGAAVSVEELQRYLEERLPGYMVPASWQVLEELPLTPNGKIDRGALGGARLARGREYVAARSETEARVARIWSEVLGVERVGVEENFFTLGGHSLLATQVVSRLRQEFGVEIALRPIFEDPTVARLSVVIDQLLGDQTEKSLPAVEAVVRGDGSFEQLVAQLQSLSAEDVKRLLSEKR